MASWRDEQRQQHQQTVDALDRLHGDIQALRTVPPEDRGYVAELQRFPALAIALRLCVDRTDPHNVVGLAQRFRRVPDEYVDRSVSVVRCVCGASVRFGDLIPCPGGCGRWFAADEAGAFAARLEDPEDEAA